ncbi:hypothetical protein BDQ94DRAFT_145938 [Aspergillus welwitschiae]|uniref:Uncharacterized protein n=1 Tax=Aspergillus welwitschiae TaxID=1341132 RepID=A0A3F3PY41_9EURO|nr:hypothetical protein BDQ94DRAFT_145938 [Aspergillus welwitschiae]RDH31880.1 hypothetical protein BDQ94DRAFT_145938 [Aspergillus welwitschiae]
MILIWVVEVLVIITFWLWLFLVSFVWERDIYIGWDVRLWMALESMKVYEMMSTSAQLCVAFW